MRLQTDVRNTDNCISRSSSDSGRHDVTKARTRKVVACSVNDRDFVFKGGGQEALEQLITQVKVLMRKPAARGCWQRKEKGLP